MFVSMPGVVVFEVRRRGAWRVVVIVRVGADVDGFPQIEIRFDISN